MEDDIERVLNAATWEPTDEFMRGVAFGPVFFDKDGKLHEEYRRIGRLYVKKYQEWLAKQYGPNPCDTCALVTILENKPRCITSNPCLKASRWLRQQQGYAKGLAEAEQLRVQLAGCGVAALGGTRDVAHQGDYGWSVSYQETLDLRLKYDALAQEYEARIQEAESRVKAREREIVEWLEQSKTLPFHWQAATELKLWLGKE